MKLAEDFLLSAIPPPAMTRPGQGKAGQTENQRGTALPAGGAEMFPGAMRLPASAGTLGEGIRPADTG